MISKVFNRSTLITDRHVQKKRRKEEKKKDCAVLQKWKKSIGHVSEVRTNCTSGLKMRAISLFSGHFQPFGHFVFNFFCHFPVNTSKNLPSRQTFK